MTPVRAMSAGNTNIETVLAGKEFQYVQAGGCKDAYDTPLPTRPLATWSPHWRELVRFVAKESSRLGLKFCLTVGRSAVLGAIAAGIRQAETDLD